MQEELKKKIAEFEKKIEIKFNDSSILLNSFIHRSYLNEHHSIKLESNERLEFLGDAVLELVVTEYLYNKFSKPEGELTAIRSALVRGQNLSKIASQLDLFEYILLSIGEKNGSEKSKSLIMANALEALIGAIYLDQGYEVVKDFISKNVIVMIDEVIEEKLYIDAKSQFQELMQETEKLTPHYKVLSESGPDHNKIFISGVYVGDQLKAKGEGSSKNISEQEAAKKALEAVIQ